MAPLMLLAIYGTLKVGHDNYDIYLRGHRPIRALFAELPYEMHASAEYPMLTPSRGGVRHAIWVEIFDVDADKLRELDELEARYGYWRESVLVGEIGKTVEIYVHGGPPPDEFSPIQSGQWPEGVGD